MGSDAGNWLTGNWCCGISDEMGYCRYHTVCIYGMGVACVGMMCCGGLLDYGWYAGWGSCFSLA